MRRADTCISPCIRALPKPSSFDQVVSESCGGIQGPLEAAAGCTVCLTQGAVAVTHPVPAAASVARARWRWPQEGPDSRIRYRPHASSPQPWSRYLLGGIAHAVDCDVTRDADIQRLHDAVARRVRRHRHRHEQRRCHRVGAPEDLPVSAWEQASIPMCCRSHAACGFFARSAGPGPGHIVNTASTSALWPYVLDRLRVRASKAAVLTCPSRWRSIPGPRGWEYMPVPGPVRTSIAEQVIVFGTPSRSRPPPWR